MTTLLYLYFTNFTHITNNNNNNPLRFSIYLFLLSNFFNNYGYKKGKALPVHAMKACIKVTLQTRSRT
jgi:hypothetical protein